MDEIRLERCTLRAWRAGDEASLARHANNRKVWINMRDVFPHPYTAEDARWWVERGSRGEGLVNWAVVVGAEAVGGFGLIRKGDVERRTAAVGYWLGESYWGRGIATEALRAVTDWAFAHLDVVRLEAGVFSWNPASARVLEKAGYTLEARHRQAVTKDGRTTDQLLYARLRAPSAP
jgi:RimJ/RimL family protein N-acetyltransferase